MREQAGESAWKGYMVVKDEINEPGKHRVVPAESRKRWGQEHGTGGEAGDYHTMVCWMRRPV